MLPQVVLTPRDNPCYVICDRGSDRSRLQVFSPEGNFIRIIKIPKVEIVSGLTGTQDRKIIIVDSIRSEVLVMTEFGDLLYFFNCGLDVIEAGDIAVHNHHFYLCDYQGHCICVFNEVGDLVRKIGQEYSGGLLNFPNGIDVSNSGEILVSDSHGNQFHLNIFNPDTGILLGSFHLQNFKVSGCIGLKCNSRGQLFTLSKYNGRILIIDSVSV